MGSRGGGRRRQAAREKKRNTATALRCTQNGLRVERACAWGSTGQPTVSSWPFTRTTARLPQPCANQTDPSPPRLQVLIAPCLFRAADALSPVDRLVWSFAIFWNVCGCVSRCRFHIRPSLVTTSKRSVADGSVGDRSRRDCATSYFVEDSMHSSIFPGRTATGGGPHSMCTNIINAVQAPTLAPAVHDCDLADRGSAHVPLAQRSRLSLRG